MNPYRYEQLPTIEDPKDIYIRLIVLPPGPKTGPISCRIFTTRLSQAPEFQAISYCWGEGKSNILLQRGLRPVSSENDVDPDAPPEAPVQVPASLITLLYRIRSREDWSRTILWVDSVCINQIDDEEKNIQVAKMRDIYMAASGTLLWIGPAADSSKEALEYAAKLSECLHHGLAVENGQIIKEETKKKKPVVDVNIHNPHLAALIRILDRPYFSRAWIVQEVVVSRNPLLICGDDSLHWRYFVSAFFYLLQSHSWIWEFHKAHRLLLLFALIASQDEWSEKKKTEWWRILARHRQCESWDPKDKIFSFWGLSGYDSFKALKVQPDYTRSIEEVYTEMTAKALENKQVEIFSVPKVYTDPTDVNAKAMFKLNAPSWVTDWRWTDTTPWSLIAPESGGVDWKPYKASEDSMFESPFDKPVDPACFPKALHLRGYEFAIITDLTPRPFKAVDSSGIQTLLEHAHTMQRTQAQLRELEKLFFSSNPKAIYTPTGQTELASAFYTVIGGKLLNDSGAETDRAIALFNRRQSVLRLIHRLSLDFIVTFMLISLLERGLRYMGYKNPEATFRNMAVPMMNRSGARLTGSNGVEYKALVPPGCKMGDVVCVIMGVSAPLVLRKVDAEEEREEWEFLGDAYVHGIMNGEIWDEEKCEILRVV